MKIRPLNEMEFGDIDAGRIQMADVSSISPLYNEKLDVFEKDGVQFPTEGELDEYLAEEEMEME